MPKLQDIVPNFYNAGIFEGEKYVQFHSHPGTEIIFIAQGECSIKLNGKLRHGDTGTLFIIPPGTLHNQVNHSFAKSIYCIFRTEKEYVTSPKVLEFGGDYWIEKWLNDIVELNNNLNPSLCNGILQSLLLRITQLEADIQQKCRLYSTILRAANYIQLNYYRNIDLSMIAKHSGISVSYLKALFKQHMAVSPIKYMQNLRMQKAKTLLKSPYLHIEEISCQCGYDDPCYFSRIFKKKHGISPIKYRLKFTDMK